MNLFPQLLILIGSVNYLGNNKSNEGPVPKNKLSNEEKEEIITVVKQEEFADLPPTQIVPKLADRGTYIASESTFYRVLRENKMQNHRGRSKKPERRLPESHLATAPNQVGHGISPGLVDL